MGFLGYDDTYFESVCINLECLPTRTCKPPIKYWSFFIISFPNTMITFHLSDKWSCPLIFHYIVPHILNAVFNLCYTIERLIAMMKWL